MKGCTCEFQCSRYGNLSSYAPGITRVVLGQNVPSPGDDLPLPPFYFSNVLCQLIHESMWGMARFGPFPVTLPQEAHSLTLVQRRSSFLYTRIAIQSAYGALPCLNNTSTCRLFFIGSRAKKKSLRCVIPSASWTPFKTEHGQGIREDLEIVNTSSMPQQRLHETGNKLDVRMPRWHIRLSGSLFSVHAGLFVGIGGV